jgi:hypothetical protein
VRRFLVLVLASTVSLAVPSTSKATASDFFSSNMVITQSTGQIVVEKLHVGKGRARLDRIPQKGETVRVTSLIMDFDHQFLFLLLPDDKMYMQILGSSGMSFYRGARLFRPHTANSACADWIPEADSRGVNLRCVRAGQETINGRTTDKWEATATNGAHGTLWYDPDLNFVIKVLRVSKEGVQSGYELQNIEVGGQQANIFEVPSDYRQFTFNRLFDLLAKLGQW